MKTEMFAAIDVGSYELACKIFEFSAKNGMREIDRVVHRLDLGSESFANGKISKEKVDELCSVLDSFKKVMETYHVEKYKAYGTSAIREMENQIILLDHIRQRTGMKVEVISNSEQRLLNYKAIASKGEEFNQIMEKGTAILDIGGGSIQISLFEKNSLIATQNLKLGVLRLEERIGHLSSNISNYESLLEETINAQLLVFKKLYLKNREIETIIIVDDYVSFVMPKIGKEGKAATHFSSERFLQFFNEAKKMDIPRLACRFGFSEEYIERMFISSVIIKRCMKVMEAVRIWTPGIVLCDGIGFEFGQKNGLVKEEHDFEKDIIACAMNLSKRYQGNEKRSETLENIALTIFDSMKKIHGLGKRERLLLSLAAILHDCGKYISMSNLGECSYNIILYTEIIGLSHAEREIVANVVKFNHMKFTYYDVVSNGSKLDRQSYLMIAKLTAILKLANGLDRSHKQKFKDIKMVLREHDLIITVNTNEDITLEKGLIGERADFFEEVFSVRPVIRKKRSIS